MPEIKFLSGNEAAARGAYEAGVSVACAYPGTPSTEILQSLSFYQEVDSQWSVNEKVAFEVAFSAAIAGKRALFAGKHVGLNAAMDPLMTSSYMGVNAGFVIITADDPGMHSSQNEQDNRYMASFARLPLLEPSNPQETLEFIKQAFSLSEEFDTPVILRLTTRISHTKENCNLGERVQPADKPYSNNINKYVMIPKVSRIRQLDILDRLQSLKKFSESSDFNQIEFKDKSLGFITHSIVYHYIREKYSEASICKLGMSFPFPDNLVSDFASKVDKLYVVEELEPFIADNLSRLGIIFQSKQIKFQAGELDPDRVVQIVESRSQNTVKGSAAGTKKPVMCPGCPHRVSFSFLKKKKITVTGDIGCYTLAFAPPLSSIHTTLCMGASITFFEGMQKTNPGKVIGVIGDSTFVHSGITGLINAVYNKAKGVILLLDNGTTAMTGLQPHPATGITLKGEQTKKLDLEKICLACGVDNVDIIDPMQFSEYKTLLDKRMTEEALTVIIVRSPCVLLSRDKAAVPEFSKNKCTNCKVCLQIDCPAIIEKGDGSIQLDAHLCTGCDLCVYECKPEAITSGR